MEKLIVIGASVAGLSAIEAFRKYNKTCSITLIGSEPYYPYNRMKLTKNLFDGLDEDELMLKKREWYLSEDILCVKDKSIKKIDTKNKVVYVDELQSFAYDKLLITTGSYSRRPVIKGIEKNRVVGLRTLEDAKRLRELLAKEVKSILIIGGGVQGLETAWSLYQQGYEVSIIELGDKLMPRSLDKETSNQLINKCEELGINIYLDTFITEIAGKECVKYVKTNSGLKLPCQILIYSIGVIPETSLLKGSPIKLEKGIVVNEKMETSVKNIYAAGDVAAYEGHPAGLWTVAMEQGKVAGARIAGEEDVIYKPQVPTLQLGAMGIQIISIGFIAEEKADFILYEKDQNKTYKIYFIDNRIVGALVVGDRSLIMPLRKAIGDKKEIKVERDMTLKQLREALKKS